MIFLYYTYLYLLSCSHLKNLGKNEYLHQKKKNIVIINGHYIKFIYEICKGQ